MKKLLTVLLMFTLGVSPLLAGWTTTPPTTALAGQSITAAANVSATFSSPGGGTLTIYYSYNGGANVQLVSGGGGGLGTYTVTAGPATLTNLQAGTYVWTMAWSGSGSASNLGNPITTVVTSPNSPPTAAMSINGQSSGTVTKNIGDVVSITISGADVDNNLRAVNLWVNTPATGYWRNIRADSSLNGGFVENNTTDNAISSGGANVGSLGAAVRTFNLTLNEGFGTYQFVTRSIDAAPVASGSQQVNVQVDNRAPSGTYTMNGVAASASVNFGQSVAIASTASDPDGNMNVHSFWWDQGSVLTWTHPILTWNYPPDQTGWSSLNIGANGYDSMGGSSSTKSFTFTANRAATFQFHCAAGDGIAWVGVGNSVMNVVVNKTTPSGTFPAASKTPQGGTTFIINTGDLNATFVNPYSGAVAAPTGSIIYSIAPNSPNGAPNNTITPGIYPLTAGLTYYIRATYPGDANYNTTYVDSVWNIAKVNQTVTISGPSVAQTGVSTTYSGAGGVTGSYNWGGTSGATGSGATKNVTFATAGTYTVTAQDPGNANYNPSNIASLTVNVTTAPTPLSSVTYNNVNYTGSAITAPVASTVPAGATYTGPTPTQTNAGTYSASITGNGSFSGTVSANWTINKANQGPVGLTGASAVTAGGSLTFTGIGGSTGNYTWGGTSGATGVSATKTVTFPTIGDYTVTVYDAGNNNYNVSGSTTVTVHVTTPLTAVTYSNATYTGAARTASVASVSPGGATYSVPTPQQTNAGTYSTSITGTGFYSGTVAANWTINKANQGTVSITGGTTVSVGGNIVFTGVGGATGTYTWGGTGGATGTGATKTVTFPTAGSFTVTAQDTGNTNYNASNTASVTVTVSDPNGDNDGDGMPNQWEIDNGLNPNNAADGPLDPDGDGLSNVAEYNLGTNPASYNQGTSNTGGAIPAGWTSLAADGDPTKAVGATAGELNVDKSGALNYSVPIWTTPGTSGMEPKVALNYSSQAGAGIAGYGWSLSGMSAITRGGQTKAIDGQNMGATLSANDRFYLDGQRLILISGNYGVAGSVYYTELDSFTKVTAVGTAGSGPASFVAKTKAGLIIEFGNTTDSARGTSDGRTEKIGWSVNKISDTKGNYINFVYSQSTAAGTQVLSRINYTGNGSVLPYASLRFEYENRPDSVKGYAFGSVMANLYRLKYIRSYFGETVARTYTLNYTEREYTQRSLLTSLNEAGSDGKEYPPLTFTYGTTAYGWEQPANFNYEPPYPLADNQGNSGNGYPTGTGFMDLNGDGRVDFIVKRDGAGGDDRASLNNGTGWTDNIPYKLPYPLATAGTNNDTGGRFVDFDGDGLVDFVYHKLGSNGVLQQKQSWRNTGSNWAPAAASWLLPVATARDSGGTDYSKNGGRFVDIDGDGRPDYVAFLTSGGAKTNLGVYLNNGNGWTYSSGFSTLPSPIALADNQAQFIDLNGDGLPDILVAYKNGSTITKRAWLNTGTGWAVNNTYLSPTYLAEANQPRIGAELIDINGDGLVDMIWNRETPTIDNGYALNTGTGWFSVINPVGDLLVVPGELGRQNSSSSGSAIIDFNADGLPDILMSKQFINVGTPKWVWLGTTHNWQPTLDSTWNLPDVLLTDDPVAKNIGSNFVDFDGDGVVDVVWKRWNSNGVVVKSLYRNKANPIADRLNKVTNGLGVAASVTYKSLLDTTVYTKGSGGPSGSTNLTGPMYVVAAINNDDGVGGQYPVSYKYANLRSDVLRGSLGFEKMTVTDGRTLIASETVFSQVYPFIGMPLTSTTKNGASLLSSSVVNYDQKLLNSGKTRFVFATNSLSTTWDLNGTKTSESYTEILPANIDSYGNILTITVASTDLPSTNTYFTKVTTSTYAAADTTNWILGRLSTASVTSSAPGKTDITRASSFTYEAGSGLLKTETVQPGDAAMSLTTTYGYDAFGNKNAATSSGYHMTVVNGNYSAVGTDTRTTSTVYDANGRFPLSTTNALNHSENYTGYDQVKGVLTNMTGANGLATSWAYDGMGRKIQENRADNTHSYTYYRWASGSAPAGSKYLVETVTDGTAPSLAFYDNFGRAFMGLGINGDGKIVYQQTAYDSMGRAYTKSNPYFNDGSTKYWTTTTSYDLLNRPLTVVTPDDENGSSTTTFSYNGLSASVIDPKGRISATDKNSQGWTMAVTRNGWSQGGATPTTIRYDYDALGNLTGTDAAGVLTYLFYDIRGRKVGMSDTDMGGWNYKYNIFGELIWQKDAKNQIVTMDYDNLGRLTSRAENEGTTTWAYDTAANGAGVWKGKLATVSAPGGYSESYAYDSLGRPSASSRTIDGTTYAMSAAYDSLGRPIRTNYPATGIGSNPVATRNVYNAFGYLKEIRNYLTSDDAKPISQLQGKVYWEADSFDVSGRINGEFFGNGLSNDRAYAASTGRLVRATIDRGGAIILPGQSYFVQDLNYSYDKMGNVKSRIDSAPGVARTEYFTQADGSDGYDGLDRLLIHRVNGGATVTVAYDAKGNITSKSDVGAYTYAGYGPHAVSAAGGYSSSMTYDANGNMTSMSGGSQGGRTLLWTSFNQLQKVTDSVSTKNSEFFFGAGHERVKQIRKTGTTLTDTTIYVGSLYEKVTTATTNTVEHKHYIMSPTGRIAVLTQSTINASIQADTLRYFHSDGLGSITVISDERGAILKRYAYDAWGKQTTLYTNTGSGITNQAPSTRGFTDHEMLADHGLIHMNGRVYDPTLGRFLSADPNVDGVSDAQGYNRYSYVGNNPLGATDPTGYWSLKDILPAIIGIVVAVVATVVLGPGGATFWKAFVAGLHEFGAVVGAGAAGGFASGFSGSLLNGGSLGDAFKAGAIGAAWGAASAAVAWGVGQYFDGLYAAGTAASEMTNPLIEGGRALAHGATQGALTEAQGGEFRHGFYAAAFSSAAGSITGHSIKGRDGWAITKRTIISATVGGTASVLGGGKFANGATTGAFQHLFNSEAADFFNNVRRAAQSDGWGWAIYDNLLLPAALGATEGVIGFNNAITFGLSGTGGLDSNNAGFQIGHTIGKATLTTELSLFLFGAPSGTAMFYSGSVGATPGWMAAETLGSTVGRTVAGRITDIGVRATYRFLGPRAGGLASFYGWSATSAGYAAVNGIFATNVRYVGNNAQGIWTWVEKPILQSLGRF